MTDQEMTTTVTIGDTELEMNGPHLAHSGTPTSCWTIPKPCENGWPTTDIC